ncbi:MAG: hypothetical protein HUJ91_06105, partial [Bacteroidales bacterium]|nr:hypothetical protein [Bacteroidales bacterium]
AYCAGTLTREEEVLSDKDIYNETVMLGLRTVKGVPCETIEAQPPVEPLVYLEKVGNNYRIPRARLFVSDDIIVKFIKQ